MAEQGEKHDLAIVGRAPPGRACPGRRPLARRRPRTAAAPDDGLSLRVQGDHVRSGDDGGRPRSPSPLSARGRGA
jgi:hypothetical protein